ncbi:MAG: ATP synthase F1 subunit delta [Elusimicrobiota bacterium]
MTASDRILARRYAAALFLCATGAREEDRTAAELREAVRAVAPRMALFRHPKVPVSQKREMLRKELGDRVSGRTLRWLELLVEKKRFNLLPQAASDFAGLLDEARGTVRASVRSAFELDARQTQELSRRLEAFGGKKVLLSAGVDEGLLAGMVVRMGDWVLDSSLQGELRRLRERLAAA